jgi:hypothetical protein
MALYCHDLAENFSLTREGCHEPATMVVEHPEGCSFPLCPKHAHRLKERWDKEIGKATSRRSRAEDMPGGFW